MSDILALQPPVPKNATQTLTPSPPYHHQPIPMIDTKMSNNKKSSLGRGDKAKPGGNARNKDTKDQKDTPTNGKKHAGRRLVCY